MTRGDLPTKRDPKAGRQRNRSGYQDVQETNPNCMGVMCGRVIQSSGPFNLAIVHGMNAHASRASNYPRRYNAAPSQELLVIRRNRDTGEVSLDPLRWGLIPYWCKTRRADANP